ncbi:MAG TPA: hypothetical protein VGL40_06690 [Bacillota bacterium]|jgi:hypothetical protein
MSSESNDGEVLDVLERLLRAQLRAIRELRREKEAFGRSPSAAESQDPQDKSMSQTDMAYEVLARSGHPLHIRDIVEQTQVVFGVSVSRDLLVSAVLKKVANQEKSVKTGKNTYGLLGSAVTTLVEAFESLLLTAGEAFPQYRSYLQVRKLAYGYISSRGRRTISRARCACHAQKRGHPEGYQRG